MKNITIVGTGHVGLVTGVTLAEIGHQVICYDINEHNIAQMKKGISPFYEPDLNDLLKKNLTNNQLFFTNDSKLALADADVIYITVGTPTAQNGSVDLSNIKEAAKTIAENIKKQETIVVTKSTVPVGTNTFIKQLIEENLTNEVMINIVSNPEFLREGSAIYDTFYADRIVIGSDSKEAASIIEEIHRPFGRTIFMTDLLSAEMIKYSSNAFLATKISFINEIANLCENIGANIEDVSLGMGLDSRIGTPFLKAGIGFGGSCFPKDTRGLIEKATEAGQSLDILEAVLKVNKQQKYLLLNKALQRFGNLKDKKIALLGLAFKPNTSDVRGSIAIEIASELTMQGAIVTAYDPLVLEEAKQVLGEKIHYAPSIEEAITNSDMVFIATEWDEFKDFPLEKYEILMNHPIIFDGRNCFSLEMVSKYHIEYYSVGRAILK
ncbi:UDP-glucose dehydrogenase family protein [Cytobacillus dafuensis]|uniref:UDP-glucose 6-dehydrogenase n=1 Tax=Cytobacillus dafuensis TaxID=1742359 RepID=A0A5B8Z1B4_CYTDA|nr:UDP-glucose/GDP-mannose dehydrogenase family protein [Cytobacillus dafuensis]QED46033.1 UDP-glucose/GDP-mannose dehydrogenase family protein [Cytobacillus dafuensis]